MPRSQAAAIHSAPAITSVVLITPSIFLVESTYSFTALSKSRPNSNGLPQWWQGFHKHRRAVSDLAAEFFQSHNILSLELPNGWLWNILLQKFAEVL